MAIGDYKSDQRKERAEAVLQLLRDTKPGDTLTYAVIELAIGVPYSRGRNDEFRAAVNSARQRLKTEHKRVTRCIQGVGVIVATGSMVVMDVAPQRMRRAARQAHHGTAELQTVNAAELTDHQRKAYAARLGTMYQQRRSLRREARLMERDVKTQTNPRRPRGQA